MAKCPVCGKWMTLGLVSNDDEKTFSEEWHHASDDVLDIEERCRFYIPVKVKIENERLIRIFDVSELKERKSRWDKDDDSDQIVEKGKGENDG